jgi:hypothetical protein
MANLDTRNMRDSVLLAINTQQAAKLAKAAAKPQLQSQLASYSSYDTETGLRSLTAADGGDAVAQLLTPYLPVGGGTMLTIGGKALQRIL